MNNSPSDWKKFRKIREIALERHCEETLKLVATARSESQTAYERYIEVHKLVQDRDRQIALAFDEPRRSRAVMQLQAMVSFGLLTAAEFSVFSEDIQQRIERPDEWDM